MFDFSKTDMVIYHDPCPDGFASAAIVSMAINGHHDVNFIPSAYNEAIPDVKGKNVLICDFSFTYDIICKMINEAKSFMIIDHHKTSEQNLIMVPDINKIFDMNHAASYLVWKAFFPDRKIPLAITLVEEHDIWKFKSEGVHEFNTMLQITPYTFKLFRQLFNEDNIFANEMIKNGKIALQVMNGNIERLMAASYSAISKIKINGREKCYNIAYVISSLYKSEIGNLLLKKYPTCDFSVVLHYQQHLNNFETLISFRSDDGKTDVSEIAKQFKGGGHRNASGAKLSGIYQFIGERPKN